MKEIFPGVFAVRAGKRPLLLTCNASPGTRFFGEDVLQREGAEFRVWKPKHSKLAAGIIKGLRQFPVRKDSVILYLGAAHGQTVSHLSDIATAGSIFAVDAAPQVVRDLVFVAEARKNILPLLMDAAHPERYYHAVPAADVLIQDVAQPHQVEIFLKNARLFLKHEGSGVLAVKARSVDVTKQPSAIFEEVRKQLGKELRIVEQKNLEPFQKDHMLFVVRKA